MNTDVMKTFLRKTRVVILSCGVAVVLSAAPLPAEDRLRVVTSLPDLASITEYVGGERVEVFSIATGFQNPHFVDPKPSYILKLSKAHMFVTVGLDLESGWVTPLLNSARNPHILSGSDGYVDASLNVPLLQVPASVNRAEGDIHIYGNPHYWLDPDRGKVIAENICKGLIRLDPAHKDFYRTKLRKFQELLDRKIIEWEGVMKKFRGSRIIAYHNEWPYFEERFGLEIVDFLEPKPGIPPTASQLAKVIQTMKAENLRVIITSPYFKAESAELVARTVDGVVVTLATSVGAEDHIETYFDLFDHNIRLMAEALAR